MGQFRALRSSLGRMAREVLLAGEIALDRGQGRKLLFLPSSGREQSSLLRAYNIADALKAQGWRTHVVPKHLGQGQRARIISMFQPDVLFVGKCRHHLNRIEYLADRPFVFDLDDADFYDSKLQQDMERVAAAAMGCICGSRFIAEWAKRFNGNVKVVWTGNRLGEGPWPPHDARGRVVAWAQSQPHRYTAEFDFVHEVCSALAQRTANFTLRLYGWPSGEDHPHLKSLRSLGVTLQMMPNMEYNDFMMSLRDVSVGLSPIKIQSDFSKGKSFGKVLGYLDAKVPVICSDEADHRYFFKPGTGVVSNSIEEWVDALVLLLEDPSARARMSELAHQEYAARLSVEAAAQQVDGFLRATLENRAPQRGTNGATPAPDAKAC